VLQPVVVYRLVTASSIEVALVSAADAKRSLEKVVLHGQAPAPGAKRRRRGQSSAIDDALLQEEEAIRDLLRPEFDVSGLLLWLSPPRIRPHVTSASAG
jgi:hypothetical protein